jgi:hypothetical protein
MAMEISRACSSAAAALFAVSFFSLSALPRVLVSRRATSAAHAAFVMPVGLSLGARGFLAFGAPSSAIHFGGMVVKEKRRSCYCAGFWREKGYMRRILEGNKINGGELPFLSPTAGLLAVSRVFVSSGVPERASESRGWPGLAGWMKAQIRAKTRNRGRGW